MYRTITLMLDGDTINYLDWLAEKIGKARNRPNPTPSMAVAWLVKQHRKKMAQKRVAKSDDAA